MRASAPTKKTSNLNAHVSSKANLCFPKSKRQSASLQQICRYIPETIGQEESFKRVYCWHNLHWFKAILQVENQDDAILLLGKVGMLTWGLD